MKKIMKIKKLKVKVKLNNNNFNNRNNSNFKKKIKNMIKSIHNKELKRNKCKTNFLKLHTNKIEII